MPSHSAATNASHRQLLRAPRRVLGDARRDDELHLALDVLRLVVVPLVVRDHDLAGQRRASASRLPSTPTSTSVPSTNSSTSTFSSCSKASATAARQLGVVVRLRDADRRAEPRRLDEDRVAVRGVAARRRRASVTLRVTGMPWSRRTDLKRSLSMQSAEAVTPGADVRDARELEQPLHGAVLAERPVQHREDDVDAARAPLRRRGPRQPLRACPARAPPPSDHAPVAVDLDGDHVQPEAGERVGDAARRRDRDLVLARAAAREDRDAAPAQGGVGDVGAVGRSCRRRRRRRCSRVGRSSLRRRRAHELPDDERHGRALLRAGRSAGPARARGRPGSGRSRPASTTADLKPASFRSCSASASASPVTSGTSAVAGPFETVTVTFEPCADARARRPGPGRSPCPFGSSESASTRTTAKPGPWSALARSRTARRRRRAPTACCRPARR